jgi:hypothetical protein
MVPILLFAFLWYGINQTIKDTIAWAGIADAAELQRFWPDLIVATAGFFAARLILRAVIEDTEAEAKERTEREFGEFRPLIEAEKRRRNTERFGNATEQGFGDGIMVPEDLTEKAYPGTFPVNETKTGALPAIPPKGVDRHRLLRAIGRKLRRWPFLVRILVGERP